MDGHGCVNYLNTKSYDCLNSPRCVGGGGRSEIGPSFLGGLKNGVMLDHRMTKALGSWSNPICSFGSKDSVVWTC